MSKLERLMNLTAELLKASYPISAETIHQRVEGYPDSDVAFHRAFERDKDDLRELGVPIIVAPVPDLDPPRDGYMIDEAQYFMSDPGLDPEELAAISLATQMVQFDQGTVAAALWMLGGIDTAEGVGPVAALSTDPNVELLFAAIQEHRRVAFRYNDTDRSVEPVRLAHRQGRWYLLGFDLTRDAERRFRLDRIDGPIEVSDPGAFEPRTPETDPDRHPWQFDDAEPVLARVLIDASRAAQARRQIRSDQRITTQPDGSIIVELDVTSVDAFRSFVLSFRHHAEVLDPPELRRDLIEWLDAMVDARHEQPGSAARRVDANDTGPDAASKRAR